LRVNLQKKHVEKVSYLPSAISEEKIKAEKNGKLM
jgi:hypothetical protein